MSSSSISMESYLPIMLLLPIIFFFIVKRKLSRSDPPLPPGPKPLPIIGNIHLMGSKPHVAIAQLAQTYGPLISFRLGGQLVVVGSSPAAAAEILKTHDHKLSGRSVPHVSFAKDPELNKNAIAWTVECTEQWKLLRSLTRAEIFSSKKVDGQTHIREKQAEEMVAFLRGKEGEEVKIRQVAFVYNFNVISNVYLSRDFLEFEEVGKSKILCELIREMMELYIAPNISDMYPLLGKLDLQGLRRKTTECVRKIRHTWEHVIKERRQEIRDGTNPPAGRRSRDFLDALLAHGFSDTQITFLFVELLAAVSDSSSSSVEWGLSELLRNGEAMKKIREEVVQHVPKGEPVRESHLSNLPYVGACVKEIMRLHPPAPLLLPHRAIRDCEVMNYSVPKDTQVFVNVWAISRDPKLWEDPLSFKPERFLNNPELDFKGNHFEFLPFGSGRRICPGLGMSVRVVELALASLIHNFDWSLPLDMLPDDISMEERYGITLMKDQPLVLIPTRRN